MRVIAKNTVVLQNSMQFNETKTWVTFQANTELSIEGNIYAEEDRSGTIDNKYKSIPAMKTPVTLFDLICLVSEIENIEEIAQQQAQEFVNQYYPEIQ